MSGNGASGVHRGGRRKSGEELAGEVLAHAANALRNLYTSVAKAIHTPLRRREELAATPSAPMRAGAASLAAVLRENMGHLVRDQHPNDVQTAT